MCPLPFLYGAAFQGPHYERQGPGSSWARAITPRTLNADGELAGQAVGQRRHGELAELLPPVGTEQQGGTRFAGHFK